MLYHTEDTGEMSAQQDRLNVAERSQIIADDEVMNVDAKAHHESPLVASSSSMPATALNDSNVVPPDDVIVPLHMVIQGNIRRDVTQTLVDVLHVNIAISVVSSTLSLSAHALLVGGIYSMFEMTLLMFAHKYIMDIMDQNEQLQNQIHQAMWY